MMGVFMFKNATKWTRRWRIRNQGTEHRMRTWMRMGLCLVMCIMWESVCLLSGCSSQQIGSDKKESLDYTVVESVDVPVELQKLIDEKKANTLRLTFTTKDYTYIVAGYGTQQTSGYSIRVNDVYLGNNAVYAEFTLIGPAASESVTEVKTTPYIVLKIEKRDESVVFNL